MNKKLKMKHDQIIKPILLIIFLCFPLSFVNSAEKNHIFSFYSGIFDVIDKEKDEQTSLLGFEHNNSDLFKDTFLGRFSPISGGFITQKNSIYLYTGVQTQYELGPLKITPSFAPGYYEKGNGKNLGSVLEFKSEIKIGFDILKGAKVDFAYSHISNNEWGNINPGVNNQNISFSKSF